MSEKQYTQGELMLLAEVAMQACLAVNPDHPLLVAQNIGGMKNTLQSLTARFMARDNYDQNLLDKARQVLSAITKEG